MGSHLVISTGAWLELLLGMLLAKEGSSLLGLISRELGSSAHRLLVMQVAVSRRGRLGVLDTLHRESCLHSASQCCGS